MNRAQPIAREVNEAGTQAARSAARSEPQAGEVKKARTPQARSARSEPQASEVEKARTHAARSAARNAAKPSGEEKAGFTLIEMLAVVAILALVAGVVLPGLGVTSGRALRYEAQRLAADLELARERSAMLGVPHRVAIDLDGGSWRTEWFVTEAEALGETSPSEAPLEGDGPDAGDRLDLAPPRGEEADYYPVPLSVGRDTALEANAFFARIDTSAGPVTRGRVAVIFERDGSTDPLSIVLRDDDGREITLDVEALDEVVRLRDAAG